MKALIIEDEQMAQASLIRLLKQNFPDIDIVGTLGTVRAAIQWFNDPSNAADIVFMDVELSDGDCFEIFRQAEVRGKVVMTTAYDNYAVKAFDVNSIDYLLKPIDGSALRRAVARCRMSGGYIDVEALASALGRERNEGTSYRKRYIVKFNDHIIPVEANEVAYFYSEDKNTFIVTDAGRTYAVDSSLDVISEGLDPGVFFRISRNCITSMKAIRSITRQSGGRLLIEATPRSPFEMTVSRSRTDDFLRWLEK